MSQDLLGPSRERNSIEMATYMDMQTIFRDLFMMSQGRGKSASERKGSNMQRRSMSIHRLSSQEDSHLKGQSRETVSEDFTTHHDLYRDEKSQASKGTW